MFTPFQVLYLLLAAAPDQTLLVRGMLAEGCPLGRMPYRWYAVTGESFRQWQRNPLVQPLEYEGCLWLGVLPQAGN